VSHTLLQQIVFVLSSYYDNVLQRNCVSLDSVNILTTSVS